MGVAAATGFDLRKEPAMSKKGMPESHCSHPNVTPLIDVVMCLIIFFMLVAKIGVSDGSDPSIKVPASIIGMKMETKSNTVLLNVNKGLDNDLPVVSAQVKGKAEPLPVMVPGTNQKPLKEALAFLRGGNDAFTVIIRGDKEMDYKYLQKVLEACAEAKIKNVSFQTLQVKQ
jgi:biopolymer transport protein ExbD